MAGWFEKMMGFVEESPDQVRANLILKDGLIESKVNGLSYQTGALECISLSELRQEEQATVGDNVMKLREVIGDIQLYHVMPENHGATFQAASQFNLLEMVSPKVTPEQGIGRYEYDLTQGPACAIACGAGTIYRNYLVEVNGRAGQTHDNQIDCLSDIGSFFGNSERDLWRMENGYALANANGLDYISDKMLKADIEEYEYIKGLLKIGIQGNTQVTIIDRLQKVTQVYCSALPVAYSMLDPVKWKAFAGLILDATYEATFRAAINNYRNTGNNRLYLTLVGGGAFGNQKEWIYNAIIKNIRRFRSYPLEVLFNSYSQSDPLVQKIINDA